MQQFTKTIDEWLLKIISYLGAFSTHINIVFLVITMTQISIFVEIFVFSNFVCTFKYKIGYLMYKMGIWYIKNVQYKMREYLTVSVSISENRVKKIRFLQLINEQCNVKLKSEMLCWVDQYLKINNYFSN